jgi:hypothetical protein
MAEPDPPGDGNGTSTPRVTGHHAGEPETSTAHPTTRDNMERMLETRERVLVSVAPTPGAPAAGAPPSAAPPPEIPQPEAPQPEPPAPGAPRPSVPPPEVFIPEFVGWDDLLGAVGGYFDRDVEQAYLERFVRRNGELRRKYICRNSRAAGVALTVLRDSGESQLFYEPPAEFSAQFAQVLFFADQVTIDIKRLAIGRQQRIALESVFSAIAYLFKLVDRQIALNVEAEVKRMAARAPKRRTTERPRLATISSEEYAVVIRQLRSARDYVLRAAARRGVLIYVGSMFYVTAIVGAALVYAAVGSGVIPQIPADPVLFITSLIAGGLGALFSVMIRMSQGKLELSRDFESREIILVGSFRPLIGIMSGAVVYVLLNSGLLPFATQSTRVAWYFYASVSFIAGFSERLIRDVLVRAESQIASKEAARETEVPT